MNALRHAPFSAGLALALVIGLGLTVADPALADTDGARAGSPAGAILVSSSASGAVGVGSSTHVSVSGDGRFVAFASFADNLVPGVGGGDRQIYRKDLRTGVVVLVSAREEGAAAADADAVEPSISADGSRVAFVSKATNLDALATGVGAQVFVRDLSPGGHTRLVSVNARLDGGGDGDSTAPSLSANGTRVAFESNARDLVGRASPSGTQIYQADLTAPVVSAMAFVSLQDSGRFGTPELANSGAVRPSVSADGNVVVFASRATNLVARSVPFDTSQVYRHVMSSGATTLVSADADAVGDDDSFAPSVSADGNRTAYASAARNLGTIPAPSVTWDQILLRDEATPSFATLVSVNVTGRAAGDSHSGAPQISADGSRVAFTSDATDLTTANTADDRQVYVRDLQRGGTTLLTGRLDEPLQGTIGAGGTDISFSGDGRTVAFTSSAVGLSSTPTDGVRTHAFARQLPAPSVDRIRGTDRYAVSAAVSRDSFGPGAPVAYVASGEVFPDALAGAAAAAHDRGPVLLVTKGAVPGAVGAELTRLAPGRIVVLGGTNTISSAVETALRAFAPTVDRLAGADRYAGSALVSASVFPDPAAVSSVFVASGEVFPDALSASAAAGHLGSPVLLVGTGGVSPAVRDELTRLAPADIVLVGGRNTVSDAVFDDLKRIAPVIRIGSADRYAVSADLAERVFRPAAPTVYIASGAVFPDALSGSAPAGLGHGPVLLVNRDSVPATVQERIRALAPARIVVLGGPNTISDAVVADLARFLPQ
ncbi:MAG: cell wall-binding repeat-containing protein [Herbiconiux sp.]|nr:cell wall-binding repeat-containing protein [Herbiconiux sp.]